MHHTLVPTRRQLLRASAGVLPLALGAGRAAAQAAYPSRPVKVVIPYPPAGGADTVGRILFQKLGEMWGAQFVIDNRGGAGGTIAAAAVAKAEHDGYTIMYDATAFSVNPSLYPRLPYDTVKDFEPIFLSALITNLMLVNKSVEAKTVADVIALAKATPGGLDWASSGNGTVQHLALEMFRHRTGIQLNHIPYRGGGLVLNDLIGGQVKFFFSNAASSIGHVQAGTLKCLAHTGRGRLATLPDVPVRASASLLGHGFEPQFAMNIALATLTLGREKLFPPAGSGGIEQGYEGPLDRIAVTAVGHWRGEGMALVEAVA